MSVHSLLGYVLEVPDLDIGTKFYVDYGLEITQATPDRVALHCHGRTRDQVVLLRHAESRKRLHHVELGATSAGVSALSSRMRMLAVASEPQPPGFGADGVWLRDPSGVLLHIS